MELLYSKFNVSLCSGWFASVCDVLAVDLKVIQLQTFIFPFGFKFKDTSHLTTVGRLDVWVTAYNSFDLSKTHLPDRSIIILVNALLLRIVKTYMENSHVDGPQVLDLREATDWGANLIGSLSRSPFKLNHFMVLCKAIGIFQSENVQNIIHGFQHGFRIGYEHQRETRWKNSFVSPVLAERVLLANKIGEDVSAGRIIGPLPNVVPTGWSFAMVSPVSLIPKRSLGVIIPDKWRLIFNLSWGKIFGLSVNDGIGD